MLKFVTGELNDEGLKVIIRKESLESNEPVIKIIEKDQKIKKKLENSKKKIKLVERYLLISCHLIFKFFKNLSIRDSIYFNQL